MKIIGKFLGVEYSIVGLSSQELGFLETAAQQLRNRADVNSEAFKWAGDIQDQIKRIKQRWETTED